MVGSFDSKCKNKQKIPKLKNFFGSTWFRTWIGTLEHTSIRVSYGGVLWSVVIDTVVKIFEADIKRLADVFDQIVCNAVNVAIFLYVEVDRL